MSKALEILKRIYLHEDDGFYVQSLSQDQLYEAIAELEVQDANSCDGCKNKGTHIFNMDCLICSRHYSDGYISNDT